MIKRTVLTGVYFHIRGEENNSERLVNTKRNTDTVPRLPIHPFTLPRPLKNIIKTKTVISVYIFQKKMYDCLLKSIHLQFELILLITELELRTAKRYISV